MPSAIGPNSGHGRSFLAGVPPGQPDLIKQIATVLAAEESEKKRKSGEGLGVKRLQLSFVFRLDVAF